VSLEELEAEHIGRVIRQTASLGEAAAILGINPATLYRKRKKTTNGTEPDTAWPRADPPP
jgi:NtrC-family two-component system response regulator AlgB